jgi:two-component system sensor histidine kinase HydH
MIDRSVDAATKAIVRRTQERFERYRHRMAESTDRMFVWLLTGQWLAGIILALTLSPYGWAGKTKVVHLHVWLAVLLGGAIISLPIVLALKHPGRAHTRHIIAAAQTLYSALLIHLSGGRIETHFHVFGSLAILGFYLDYAVLATATVVIAGDHFVRGLIWPESVYGIVNPEWWRFLEHSFWVLFIVSFLTLSIRRHLREWVAAAEEGGLMEAMAEGEWRRSSVLDREEKSAGVG